MADQFIREAEAGKDSTLLEPENGAEAGGEEYSFNYGKRNEACRKGVLLGVTPIERPLGFASDGGDGLHCTEELLFFLFVAGKVRVNEESVGLSMHVLHGGLEGVETLRFRELNFTGKVCDQILGHDAVRCCKEGKDHEDEVFFVGGEGVKVAFVIAEVNFFGGPEGGHVFLVEIEKESGA